MRKQPPCGRRPGTDRRVGPAWLLADNVVLMRLRELEVLEKIAAAGKLNIVVGEKGLDDPVVNLP